MYLKLTDRRDADIIENWCSEYPRGYLPELHRVLMNSAPISNADVYAPFLPMLRQLKTYYMTFQDDRVGHKQHLALPAKLWEQLPEHIRSLVD